MVHPQPPEARPWRPADVARCLSGEGHRLIAGICTGCRHTEPPNDPEPIPDTGDVAEDA